MMTRLHTALAVCVCVTGCVYSSARPTPPPPAAQHPTPPPPVTSTTPSGSGSSGQAQTNTPKETQGPEHAADSAADTKNPKRRVERLDVPIQAKGHSQLIGKVQLTDLPSGVKVVVKVDRIKPGLHGVFIHNFADCSGKDASSVGPHFNPDDKEHALPAGKRHLGDLGNLVAQYPDGKGRLEVVVPHSSLAASGPRSVLNRALIIHAEEDDGTRQARANAGKPIGCAELTIAAAQTQPDGRVVWRQ